MALSQVQCLDDNHINLRTSESKPDFFYSEDQRLALETLIQEGRDAFEEHIQTNKIRSFLSDLELERILDSVEVYSPGLPDDHGELYGEIDGEDVSLQYWPDLSDLSLPQLDIGWPDRMSYRGVTRVQVYTQPPYEGQPHIKEVIRKMIGQAQKVIAIVMDLFTDMDIFKDILDASFRRKVAVYIILESTEVRHFLRMCDKAGMHTGHLKNLRVRTIRGIEFFSRSSKRVCGNQSQKFMFIDGDKAVSGSYSFTWSSSRLDRNLITVLTGQAVEILDSLFQDMYVMSNGVCLNKINLGNAPEPEINQPAVPTLFPTANIAFKLINPKYSLVSSCMLTTNGPDQNNAKIPRNQQESVKHITEVPTLPPIHPGLLNLEKANMIQYVPTWPDPEPPSDVIGFINIRDSNKPLQAHLMRSELFGVSQAIRFKDNISGPEEPVMACPISKTPSETPAQIQAHAESQISEDTENSAKHLDKNQQQEKSQREDPFLPLQPPQPETVHVLTGNKEDKEALDVMNKENQNTLMSFNAKDDTKQAPDAQQPQPSPTQTPEPSSETNKSHQDSFNKTDNNSVNDKVLMDVETEPMLAAVETHENGNDTHSSYTNSSVDSLSEYYDCFSPLADPRPESDALMKEKQSDLHSSHYQMKNLQGSNSYTAHGTVCLDNKLTLFTPKVLKTSCNIVFNFASSELMSPAPFTTIPVQENGKSANASTQPDKPSNPVQTPEWSFNFSSTSEEYFECSDTVGCSFDGKVNVMETGSQRKNVYQNEPHNIREDLRPTVKQKILKRREMTVKEAKLCNPEVSCQEMTEMFLQEVDNSCDPESSCEYMMENGSEKQSYTEKTVNGRLEANNSETVLKNEHDPRPQMDENIHRQQMQENQVRACMWPDEPEITLEIQPKKMGTEKTTLDLGSKLSLDILCEGEFDQTAEKTSKQSILDFQLEEMRKEKSKLVDFETEINLDLHCEGEYVKAAEKYEKPIMLDLQSKVDLDLTCGREFKEMAEKPSVRDLKPEINLDLLCEREFVTTDNTEKQEMSDLQSGGNIDLTFEEESEELAEKSPVLDFLPEDTFLTSLESESKHPSNLKSAEQVNELKLWDVEVSQTGLKPEEFRERPEDFDTVELLILEDSDLQEFEDKVKNQSDPRKTKTASSTEAKRRIMKPAGLKMVNDRKPTENEFELYSTHEIQTCHLRAPVKKTGEEHASAIQVKKKLPKARPKLDCLVSKQPHQTSNGISIAEQVPKPYSMNRQKRHHGHLSGQLLGQNNPFITASPCAIGEMTILKTHQIQQRHPWTVQTSNDSTSSTKFPQIQPHRPTTLQSDQHVSRKHSAQTISQSGTLFPRHIKNLKQTSKESSTSKRKLE